MPKVSVIIVAFCTNQHLIRCLDSLMKQTESDFEVLVIDNGGNESIYETLKIYPLTYIQLTHNYKPSLARNVGITYAKGDIVCFLDDDALADEGYIAWHLWSFQNRAPLGVRGKVLPKTDCLYNCLAFHYNLGEELVPTYIDMENNASFRREVLVNVGGFNPLVFYGEGAELTYRIFNKYGGHDQFLYQPHAVVYHDYANHWKKLIRKNWTGAKSQVVLESMYPDFWKFITSYHPLPQGPIPHYKNLKERIQLALLRRLARLTRSVSVFWFRNIKAA